MCIIYKLGSGVGLSQNFRHSPSLKIVGDIGGEFWKWRFDNWHTTPYEMCHLPNCHNTSCVSCTHVLEWIYPSRHTPSAQSIPNSCDISDRTYSNLDVYVHMIACISTRCNVCVDMRTCAGVSTRFVCSYSIWDDEWWWVSRLDLMMRSRLDLWDCVSISTRKFYQVSTRFYVWIWGFFRPLGWQTARLMLRSLSPQHPDTF